MANRILALDNLRTFAGMLRCCIHASVPYMVFQLDFWPVQEEPGMLILDYFVFVFHSIIEELFFFIAGFVAFNQMVKYSYGTFIRIKLKRIVLPFAVSMIVLIPIVLACFGFVFVKNNGTETSNGVFTIYIQSFKVLWRLKLPTAHLWFLYYLALYYFSFSTLIYFFRKYRIKYNLDFIFQKRFYPRLIPILLFLPLVCLMFMEKWYVINSFNMIPQPLFFSYFFPFFLIGMLTVRHDWLIGLVVKYKNSLMISGFAISLGAGILQGFYRDPSHPYYQQLGYLAKISTYLVTLTLGGGLMGFFFSYGNKKLPLLNALIPSNYWSYLVHLPIVIVAQVIMYYYLPVPVILKFLISLSVSFLLPYLMFRYLLPKSFIKWIH